MARIKVGVTAHARHKKIIKMAKGYRGTRHELQPFHQRLDESRR